MADESNRWNRDGPEEKKKNFFKKKIKMMQLSPSDVDDGSRCQAEFDKGRERDREIYPNRSEPS